MKILGIDTSSRYCNLSIIEDEDIMIEYSINGLIKKHSSILIPAIKEMLTNINMEIQDMDGIAVTIGPGSFTGLRIGIGTVKGLSYAASVPITGVITLDVLAHNVEKMPYLICPVLDARKGEVYFSLYRGGEQLCKIIDYKCESIEELLKRLKNFQEKIIFLGEGMLKYQSILKEKISSRAIFIHPSLSIIKASNVAFMGLEKIKKGKIENVYSISPFYLRKSEAEIAWEKSNKSV
ncbi:MAG: tRNA (adenosine(37)-N6)-threonylcarbamoyltransferase complex dimerization subunit type 1 TsaB [Candidatus Caldatribacteriota bacterium]|nr:tRNA (adenosine(37)-N6)-threonylcarbamoyltransferase complex dimerization subunit type 1 TsaB [Candidatus Caldatribacteriota bacterium]